MVVIFMQVALLLGKYLSSFNKCILGAHQMASPSTLFFYSHRIQGEGDRRGSSQCSASWMLCPGREHISPFPNPHTGVKSALFGHASFDLTTTLWSWVYRPIASPERLDDLWNTSLLIRERKALEPDLLIPVQRAFLFTTTQSPFPRTWPRVSKPSWNEDVVDNSNFKLWKLNLSKPCSSVITAFQVIVLLWSNSNDEFLGDRNDKPW